MYSTSLITAKKFRSKNRFSDLVDHNMYSSIAACDVYVTGVVLTKANLTVLTKFLAHKHYRGWVGGMGLL